MADISIKKSFSMPLKELKSELNTLAKELEKRFQITCVWEGGSCLSFKRRGAKGKILIRENNFELSLSLGLVLKAFKGKIETEMHNYISHRVS